MTNLILHMDYRYWRRDADNFMLISQADCLTSLAEERLTAVMNLQVRDLLCATATLGVQMVDDLGNPEQVLIVPDSSSGLSIKHLEDALLTSASRNCTGYVDCTEAFPQPFGWAQSDDEELPPITYSILDWAADLESAFWIMSSEGRDLVIPRSNAAELLLRHRWVG